MNLEGRISMRKKVLKVLVDFYKKDIKVGDQLSTFGGSLRIWEMDYKNEFGTFILCEHIEKNRDAELDSKWTKKRGVTATVNSHFEVLGTIHIPDYRNMLGGIGFFVKNHDQDEVLGLSYEQTWNLLFHEGAKNAEASSSHYNNFHTKLIDTIEGLPSFESYYWKIPAYNSEGVPYASFTREALSKIEKGIENAVDSRLRERVNQRVTHVNEILTTEISEISHLIKKSNKIVVLTGAGISTNSGIPDYRSSVKSIWRKNPIMLNQLNQASFESDPAGFWNAFYQLLEGSLSSLVPFPTEEAFLATIKAIKPNNGHHFLAWLHRHLNKELTVITQNVDGLDKKAGSQRIIEMHGNIHECVCSNCGKNYPLLQVIQKHKVPRCECGSVIRPNLVFFGDTVQQYDEAVKAVEKAELIIVVGTSLQVYPFNQLLHAKDGSTKVVLINDSHLETDTKFDHTVLGDITRICHDLKRVLEKDIETCQ